MAQFILVLLAFLCALVAALTGFDFLIHASHYFGWVAASLCFFFLSLLVGLGAPMYGARREG